jgi:uncharacterized protein YaiI (UPF0178 family)
MKNNKIFVDGDACLASKGIFDFCRPRVTVREIYFLLDTRHNQVKERIKLKVLKIF